MAQIYDPEFPSSPGAGRAPEPQPVVHEVPPAERAAPVVREVPAERPLADVLKDIIGSIQEIIRSELRLARSELREKVIAGGKAAVLVTAGAVFVFYSFAFVLVAIYNALAIVLPYWLAAVIIFAGLGIAAGIMISVGMKRLRRIRPTPERTMMTTRETVETVTTNAQDTVQTVKEEVQWSRDRVR